MIWIREFSSFLLYDMTSSLLEIAAFVVTQSFSCHSSFFCLFSTYIYALCNDLESLIYTTTSVLKDFQADGVIYLELRTTPRAIPSANITKDDYVQTILQCISDFNEASASNLSITPMTTNLLLSIDRRNDLPTALAVVDLALKYHSRGVVGIDLCGDPAVGDVSMFQPAFVKAKEHDLKVTIHFAEAPQSSTDAELRTLLSYWPDRIGHVINVPRDIKDEVVRRKLGVELCLSCNVHAKMITGSFGEHHFGWWKGTGCPIILCVGYNPPGAWLPIHESRENDMIRHGRTTSLFECHQYGEGFELPS